MLGKLDGGLVDGENLVSRLGSFNSEGGESVPGTVKVLKEGLDVGVVGGVSVEFSSAVDELVNSDFSIDEASSSGWDVESVSVAFNEEGGVVEETVDTGGVGGQGAEVDGLDGFLSDGVDLFVVASEDDVGNFAELLAGFEVVFVLEGVDEDGEVLHDLFVVVEGVGVVEF